MSLKRSKKTRINLAKDGVTNAQTGLVWEMKHSVLTDSRHSSSVPISQGKTIARQCCTRVTLPKSNGPLCLEGMS